MQRFTATLFAVVCTLALAGCSTTTPSGAPSGVPSPGSFNPGDASDVGRYFKISEVGLGDDGWVTLVNYTDTPASLATLFLCQAGGCVDLPDYNVAAGAAARIAVGDGNGLADVAMTGADLDLPSPDGEIALFSTDDIDDPNGMRAYLEWGTTPHELTDMAIANAIWLDGSYAPTSAVATRLFQNDSGLWLFDED
jgi:hypothetical protein